MRNPISCCILVCGALQALANVEKTIFLAPPSISISTDHPNLEDLYLDLLSPSLPRWNLRRQIAASFPTPTGPRGDETWLLLEGLEENRRYEVRICWPATQPTSFFLDTYEVGEVFNTPKLISSLTAYSETRQVALLSSNQEIFQSYQPYTRSSASEGAHISILFLRVSAAADYFTTNVTLMQDVPPVDVDIILDPFLLNMFPKSLLPTAGYLIGVAIGALFLSDFIWQCFNHFSQSTKTLEVIQNPQTTSSETKKNL